MGCGCGVVTPDRVILAMEADALRPLVPVFLRYVLSFLYVGIFWTNVREQIERGSEDYQLGRLGELD